MAVSAPALKRALVPSWLSASSLRRWPIFQVGVIGLFIVIALFGTWIAPSDPYEIDLRGRLAPPAWMEGAPLNIFSAQINWVGTFSAV